MKIYGLMANVKLVKSFTLGPNGERRKTAYPNAYNFGSLDFGTNLHYAVRVMADAGGCLLKGELDRGLDNEPRAGHTSSSQKTEWICLDLDGITAWNTVDDFLEAIGCGEVSRIVQWSNSAGLVPGLRCHVFMALDTPAAPERLKRWLMHSNLSNAELRAEIALNKIGTALKWPLDVTTCQNDKLIYVAPPRLGPGIVDPFAGRERIELCERGAATLTLPALIPGDAALRADVQSLIVELRAASRLPPLQIVRGGSGTEYACALEEALVTGCKVVRDFVYFNLNGGNSWGYYHSVNDPEFIRNFKGEPNYLTAELLPSYWKELLDKREAQRCGFSSLESGEMTVGLVFRERSRTALQTLNLQQAAALLLLHPTTLAAKARAGEIPGARIGKRWVFVEVDLLDYLRSQYASRALQGDSMEVTTTCHSTNVMTRPSGGSKSPTKADAYSRVLGLPIESGPRSTTTS